MAGKIDNAGLSADDIMEDVVASECFGKSARQIKLLRYLLEKTIAGEFHKVTQYSIAIDVMDRATSFDGGSDSIVRVEMHRLRTNLKMYNTQDNKFTINLPRASYRAKVVSKKSKTLITREQSLKSLLALGLTTVVLFVGGLLMRSVPAAPEPVSRAVGAVLQCDLVRPNVSIKNSGQNNDIQRQTDRLIRATLSQHTNLNMLQDNTPCQPEAAPRFFLDYMAIERGDNYNITLTVFTARDGGIVAYEEIAGVLSVADMQGNLSTKVTALINEIARPYGVLSRTAVTYEWPVAEARDNYRCLIAMYDSFSARTEEDYDNTNRCLERAAKSPYVFPDLLGGLAASYIERTRYESPQRNSVSFMEAKKILDNAGESWVNSAEMAIAKMAFEIQRPDFDVQRSHEILSLAETKFSSHPPVLMTAALYMGYVLGDWQHAKELSDYVKDIHTSRDNSVYLLDAAYAYLHTPSQDLMQVCEEVYSPNFVMANILVMSCAQVVGDNHWLELTQSNLERLGFGETDKQIAYMQQLRFERNLETALIAQLREITEPTAQSRVGLP